MAVTTEIDGIHTVRPPLNGSAAAPTPKRPRGRPQKCRECGESIDPTKAHVCSAPASAVEEVSGDEDFWLMLSNFSPEEWNHLTAYLYRVMPRIDRKANGKPINLGAYSAAFTRDDIMSEHGSGVYRIDLNQLEPASSRSRRIAREVFTIINPKYPPIVPPGDWVDDKVNDMWRWGAPAGTSNAGIAAGYPPGFNIENVMERQEKGLMMGIEMARAMAPAPAPAKDDSELYKLLGVLINRPAPVLPPPDNSHFNLIIEELRADRKELRADLKELRDKATAPPPQKNLLEQIKEIQPALLAAKELMGDSKPGSWWEGPLQTLMEGAAEAIPAVVDMVKTGQQKPAPHAWTPPQGQQQQQPQIVAANPQQQQPAQPQQQPAAAEESNLTEEQRTFRVLTQKWGQFVLLIRPQMIEYFRRPDGFGGLDFRDWFVEGHGMFNWSDMRRELGPGVLGQMIAEHPQLSVEIAPEEQRKGFLEQFFTLPVDEDEEQVPGDGVIEIGGDNAA